MKDKYLNFKDLKKSESSKSFNIKKEIYNNDSFLIFSPHGGGIEQGTSEITKHIANKNYSYYLFEGKGNNCKRLHIKSTNFNEPILLKLLKEHKYAISIHGMTNEMQKHNGSDIFLGGLNKNLIEITTKILMHYDFNTSNNFEYPKSRLSGKELKNVTNKCISREGMQIEISECLRAKLFFADFKEPRNRNKTTKYFDCFCDAINKSIKNFLTT